MAITTSGTTLTFNDATTQTTAPVNTNANVTSATAVAGTGISVTAVTTTGAATHTVTNTGVTSIVAGRGVSVSASTGAVTTSLAAGTILQVVSTFDNTQYVFNSGSTNQTTYYSISGLTATITPSSTSSKILLIGSVSAGQQSNSYNNYLRFYRNSTAVGIGNPTNYNAGATGSYRSNDGSAMGTIAMSFLDSPATTSAITYSIQICNSGGGSYPSYINRCANNNTGWEQSGASNFIVMEIAG